MLLATLSRPLTISLESGEVSEAHKQNLFVPNKSDPSAHSLDGGVKILSDR